MTEEPEFNEDFVSGLEFDEAAAGCMEVDAHGVAFQVPSASSLMVNKRASGRPKDLEDIQRLQAVTDSPGREDEGD